MRTFSRGVRDPARVLLVGTHADTMESEAAKQNVWNELKPEMRSFGNISGYVEVSCKTGQGFENLEQGIAKAMAEAKLGVMDVPFHFHQLFHCRLKMLVARFQNTAIFS